MSYVYSVLLLWIKHSVLLDSMHSALQYNNFKNCWSLHQRSTWQMHNDAVPTNFSTFARFQCVTFIEPGKKLCQICRPKILIPENEK